jgi:hypothetical protein
MGVRTEPYPPPPPPTHPPTHPHAYTHTRTNTCPVSLRCRTTAQADFRNLRGVGAEVSVTRLSKATPEVRAGVTVYTRDLAAVVGTADATWTEQALMRPHAHQQVWRLRKGRGVGMGPCWGFGRRSPAAPVLLPRLLVAGVSRVYCGGLPLSVAKRVWKGNSVWVLVCIV